MKSLAEILRNRIEELGCPHIKTCSRNFEIPYDLLCRVITSGHLPKDKTLLFYADKLGINAAELIAAAYRQRAPVHLQYLFEAPGDFCWGFF